MQQEEEKKTMWARACACGGAKWCGASFSSLNGLAKKKLRGGKQQRRADEMNCQAIQIWVYLAFSSNIPSAQDDSM